MTFYIADLHLGHKNVLRFDNRPFSTIEENDEYMYVCRVNGTYKLALCIKNSHWRIFFNRFNIIFYIIYHICKLAIFIIPNCILKHSLLR